MGDWKKNRYGREADYSALDEVEGGMFLWDLFVGLVLVVVGVVLVGSLLF